MVTNKRKVLPHSHPQHNKITRLVIRLVLTMATHSSVLAWRIPGTGDPGGLPSMESHRVGND